MIKTKADLQKAYEHSLEKCFELFKSQYNEITELKSENERLKSDVQFFVDRVESGVARSKATYARFKDTLEAINK